MNRLPEYDKNTGQSERLAFLILGLAGTLLAVFAALDAGRFAMNRDCIVAVMTGDNVPAAQAAAVAGTNYASTNFAVIHPLPHPVGISVFPKVVKLQNTDEGTLLSPFTVVPRLWTAWPTLISR